MPPAPHQHTRPGAVSVTAACVVPPSPTRPSLRTPRAQEVLEEASAKGSLAGVKLSAFLDLAACYWQRGQPRYAADVLLLGASARPGCALLWNRAGLALEAAGAAGWEGRSRDGEGHSCEWQRTGLGM
jgi:hypothetical protein